MMSHHQLNSILTQAEIKMSEDNAHDAKELYLNAQQIFDENTDSQLEMTQRGYYNFMIQCGLVLCDYSENIHCVENTRFKIQSILDLVQELGAIPLTQSQRLNVENNLMALREISADMLVDSAEKSMDSELPTLHKASELYLKIVQTFSEDCLSIHFSYLNTLERIANLEGGIGAIEKMKHHYSHFSLQDLAKNHSDIEELSLYLNFIQLISLNEELNEIYDYCSSGIYLFAADILLQMKNRINSIQVDSPLSNVTKKMTMMQIDLLHHISQLALNLERINADQFKLLNDKITILQTLLNKFPSDAPIVVVMSDRISQMKNYLSLLCQPINAIAYDNPNTFLDNLEPLNLDASQAAATANEQPSFVEATQLMDTEELASPNEEYQDLNYDFASPSAQSEISISEQDCTTEADHSAVSSTVSDTSNTLDWQAVSGSALPNVEQESLLKTGCKSGDHQRKAKNAPPTCKALNKDSDWYELGYVFGYAAGNQYAALSKAIKNYSKNKPAATFRDLITEITTNQHFLDYADPQKRLCNLSIEHTRIPRTQPSAKRPRKLKLVHQIPLDQIQEGSAFPDAIQRKLFKAGARACTKDINDGMGLRVSELNERTNWYQLGYVMRSINQDPSRNNHQHLLTICNTSYFKNPNATFKMLLNKLRTNAPLLVYKLKVPAEIAAAFIEKHKTHDAEQSLTSSALVNNDHFQGFTYTSDATFFSASPATNSSASIDDYGHRNRPEF